MRTTSTTECPGGKGGGAQTPASADGGASHACVPAYPCQSVQRAAPVFRYTCALNRASGGLPEGDRPWSLAPLRPARVRVRVACACSSDLCRFIYRLSFHLVRRKSHVYSTLIKL